MRLVRFSGTHKGRSPARRAFCIPVQLSRTKTSTAPSFPRHFASVVSTHCYGQARGLTAVPRRSTAAGDQPHWPPLQLRLQH
jgi:hypothetical protein